jgi:hypothetical protein
MKKTIFIILSIQIIVYWFAFDFLRWIEFDTPSYISGARYLFNIEGGADIQSRISKPLVLFLPGLIEKTLNIHPNYIFILQNTIAFYACGFLIYSIMKHIYKEETIALSAMIMFTTCQVFAIFSLFIISDVIAWFFMLLLIYMTLTNSNTNSLRQAFLIAIIACIGVFSKENAIAGLVFFMFFILFSNKKLINKITLITTALLSFLILFICGLLIMENTLDTSIISRIADTREYYDRVYYRLSDISQFYRVFDVFWLIFIISLPQIFKHIYYHKNQIILASLSTLIVTILLLPIHPFVSDRIFFTIVPFLVILSGDGLIKVFTKTHLIIGIGGVLNIIVAWIIYSYNMKNLLYVSLIIYFVIITIHLLFLRKKSRQKTTIL